MVASSAVVSDECRHSRDRAVADRRAETDRTTRLAPSHLSGARSASDLEALRSSLRAFARLRQSAEAGAEGTSPGLQVEDDAAGAERLPLDLAKTFVGPNGTYYDESWRLMEWRGAQRSWNGRRR